jgi:hypothetical protein
LKHISSVKHKMGVEYFNYRGRTRFGTWKVCVIFSLFSVSQSIVTVLITINLLYFYLLFVKWNGIQKKKKPFQYWITRLVSNRLPKYPSSKVTIRTWWCWKNFLTVRNIMNIKWFKCSIHFVRFRCLCSRNVEDFGFARLFIFRKIDFGSI